MIKEPKRSLGEYLRFLRMTKLEGMGLKKIAPKLEIDYTYLSKIERNEQKPSPRLLYRIYKTYGLTMDEWRILYEKAKNKVKFEEDKALFESEDLYRFFRKKYENKQ